jgi:hypothetical protein
MVWFLAPQRAFQAQAVRVSHRNADLVNRFRPCAEFPTAIIEIRDPAVSPAAAINRGY